MARRQKAINPSLRNFQILRTLTNSKSVTKSSIVMDALLYICKLKVHLEALRREVINNIQAVKVEKLEGSKFLVRVTCKMEQDLLVSLLEEFDKLKIHVCQASVTCKYFFGLEAIVEAEDELVDVKVLAQAVHEAVFHK